MSALQNPDDYADCAAAWTSFVPSVIHRADVDLPLDPGVGAYVGSGYRMHAFLSPRIPVNCYDLIVADARINVKKIICS